VNNKDGATRKVKNTEFSKSRTQKLSLTRNNSKTTSTGDMGT